MARTKTTPKAKPKNSAEHSPLGKDTQYVAEYDPTLLYPIDRGAHWQKQGIKIADLPMKGVDIWNAYEVSWLTPRGKPEVRLAEIRIPARSPFIIESKSLKLYLNSYNQTRLESQAQVQAQIEKDLSAAAGAEVKIDLYHPDQAPSFGQFSGFCIDNMDIDIEHYQPHPKYLTTGEDAVEEVLFSHLLRSNCPVTGQPDWATIGISYRGQEIDREGLLRYLISYREKNDFHEQCVEEIYMDIWNLCQPEALSVYARYVRRGGLDINPFRSSEMDDIDNLRLSRQ